MIVGVISVGVMTVGVLSVGVMTLSQIMYFNAARINLTKMIFFYNYAVLYLYTIQIAWGFIHMFYLRNKKHDYLLQLNCAIRDLQTGLSTAYLKTMCAAIKRSRAASAITLVKDNTRASIIYSISLVNISCLLFSRRYFVLFLVFILWQVK